jgi:ElaB/YqjD/DUF883 family membrane-anchored ribosome-binding protein
MDEQPEAIRQQIDETRIAMADKLATLEEKVVDTVKDTTEAVTETVETVKETVAETVDTVKNTVQETVQTVKRTFDLQRQFDRHPWLMVTGSCLTGFLAGRLLSNLSARSEGRDGWSAPAPRRASATAAESKAPEPGVLSTLAAPLEEGFSRLKEMAVGAFFGMLRDQARQALPENLQEPVVEVLDDMTTKLGGKVAPESEAAPWSSERPSSSQESASPVPSGSAPTR